MTRGPRARREVREDWDSHWGDDFDRMHWANARGTFSSVLKIAAHSYSAYAA